MFLGSNPNCRVRVCFVAVKSMAINRKLPVVSSFWYGSDLSWMEALCIQSYLDNGHHFILYTAERLEGIPEGAEVRPASEIFWPPPFDISDNDRLRVAVFSDLFRLYLIQKTDCIWVDLDAYCVRPFDFDSPYVFGKSLSGGFLTGVLKLPKDSQTLTSMIDFLTSANPTQPWRGASLHRTNLRRTQRGEVWGIEALPWGCSGPKAFGHFLQHTGEEKYALPARVFYSFGNRDFWRMHSPKVATEDIEEDDVYSIHFYGHQRKKIAKQFSGVPRKGSYFERLCDRHNIDPGSQPVPAMDWMLKKTR